MLADTRRDEALNRSSPSLIIYKSARTARTAAPACVHAPHKRKHTAASPRLLLLNAIHSSSSRRTRTVSARAPVAHAPNRSTSPPPKSRAANRANARENFEYDDDDDDDDDRFPACSPRRCPITALLGLFRQISSVAPPRSDLVAPSESSRPPSSVRRCRVGARSGRSGRCRAAARARS